MKLLFTSAGRRVELIQAFDKARRRLKIEAQICGADITNDAPALFFCDRRFQICRISDKRYIPSLLTLCQDEKIDLIIPTIDTDLLILSENKSAFEAIGTRVLVSSPDMIKICRDKRKTGNFFLSCGLDAPEAQDDVLKYKGDFPCFIKPPDGSSSINAFRADTREELEALALRLKEYVIQPFIEGREYTVDVFCDFNGRAVCITPRERLAVRSGEVLKTRIDMDARIIEESKKLIERFKPSGPLTLQLIRQKSTGRDFFIEINARFGGGAPLSMLAGADSAEALLRLLRGEKPEATEYEAVNGLVYSRFDQCVCIQERREMKTISSVVQTPAMLESEIDTVIFDLDDTIYPEDDYARSGFKSVAARLNEIKDAETRLWKYHKAGKMAIDELLNEEGVMDEGLKAACLEAYRNNIPSLTLAEDVKNMLVLLRQKGYKLGIITDGRPEGQWAKIKSLGLEELVDAIIVTDELGGISCRKPNDISFRLMKEKLKTEFYRMAYVGDNPRKDFAAPNALGMQSLWIKGEKE